MQPSPVALLAALALPFLGAALVPAVYRVLGERTAYFAAAVAAVCFGLLASQYEAAMTARRGADALVYPWFQNPLVGEVAVALYLDGLALLIGFLATGVGVLVFTYSGGYMHDEPGQAKYYATLLVFMGSMLGVALAADLVALFVFWELTSVSSYVLIGHYQRTDASMYAARKAMLITVSGGLFMLVGFLLLAFVSGQAGLSRFVLVGTPESMIANAGSVQEALRAAGVFGPVLALVGIGAAAKSAQVPLHVWLPNAMEAPTPVSAFLHSATMVKAGVYLVGRFRPLLLPESFAAPPDWMLLFATLGLVSMTVTAMLAVGATDIKELLAYSTASHLGLIIAGFGLAGAEATDLGAETGAFHILNHAVFKAALFLVAGIIAHEAGTRVVDEIGGLWRDMPVVAAITGVAALGMAGVPPFNGFYSKELLFETVWDVAVHEGGTFWLLPVVAVFGSVFTFLYSVRFLMLFFGEKPDALGGVDVHRPPLAMLAPAGLLGVLAAVIAVAPQLAVDVIVQGVYESALPVGADPHHVEVHLPTKLSPAFGMSLVTVAAGVVAYPFYDRLHRAIRRASAVPVTSPNWYYDATTAALNDLSDLVPARVQTGVMRTYAAWVFGATSVLVLAAYLGAGALGALPAFPGVAGLAVTVPLLVVLLVAIVGAVAVGIAPSHIAGVLTLSILGFMVAVFFVLASAPDLALTQLVVETLVLVIFLLVLDKLPAFYGDLSRRRAVVDGVVAGAVGLTVFLTVVLATAGTPDAPIFHFFIERAGVPAEHGPVLVDWGGGGNVVNVILVDFRAFDTLGEISVVALAALSVLTLVGMRGRGEQHE